MVMKSSKRRMERLSKMILSSSVRVGGGVQNGVTVADEAGDDSIDIGVVVPVVVSTVVVMGVGVVGLRGAALPSMAFVLSVSGAGFSFLGWSAVCRWFKQFLFLRLFLLSCLHRRE